MSTTAPKPITAATVATFLRTHLPYVADWPDEQLLPWVAWFLRVDRVLVLTDDADEICGVALGRFVRSIDEIDGRGLYDDPAGPIVWVDAIATSRPEALPQIIALLPLKYGDRKAVAGKVFNRSGELRMFPMKTLNRFFGGPQHG